jgi:hypothetical protein
VSAAVRQPAEAPDRAAWIASTVLLLLMMATILAATANA